MFLQNVALVIVLQILTVVAVPRETSCVISINQDMVGIRPLILNQGRSFIFPEIGDRITVEYGSSVEFNCAQRTLRIDGTSTGVEYATATCIGNTFYINAKYDNVHVSSLTCSQHPVPVARWTRNRSENKKEFEIGFTFKEDPTRFLTLIEGSFDENSQNTLYTKIYMNYQIRGHQAGVARPAWKKDLFTVTVNSLYTIKKQRKTINSLLSLPEESKTCIQDSYNYYLAGGHLAAMGDFIFGSHQRATFYRLNAAPMWQVINNGNWKALESAIRELVKRYDSVFTVYTGTHEVCTLKRCPGKEFTPQEQEIELYLKTDGNSKIPVPKFFWKVIYNEDLNKGMAFIVVNDPYLKLDEIEKYTICPNICSNPTDFDWLTWKPENMSQGYAYCCNLEDFSKVVTTLPWLKVTDLLR